MPRKKTSKPVQEYSSYPIKIINWTPNYSISLDTKRRFSIGPYSEHNSLKIDGQLLGPKKLAGREIDVYIFANRQITMAMTIDDVYEKDPIAVGGLTSRGSNCEYYGSIPSDVFPSVLAMLAAGKYNYILLHGHVMKYGSASIEYMSFAEEFDPDEWCE